MTKTLGKFIARGKSMWNLDPKLVKKLKIYVGVVLLQFGFAGFAIIAKFALNKGTSHYVFSIYRNAIAAIVFAPFAIVLERKVRPKMTLSILLKIMLLGLLDPIIGQNLFYAGMKYTTATFTAAMCNVLPALTFLMAWILRVEKVNIKKLDSQAKILGTVVTVGGAMIMTLIRGADIGLPWTTSSTSKHINISTNYSDHQQHAAPQSPIKGAIMIGTGNIGYALFYILQAITLKTYPAGLSLTSLICTFGALQGVALTLVLERGNRTSIWSIGFDSKLLAYAYGGIVSSGITYYVSGAIMKEKGPVFVTAFNPLNMVIVAVLSSFILAEHLDVGKITGALVIIIGLYLVIWGKTNKEDDEDESSTSSSSSSSSSSSHDDHCGSKSIINHQQLLETNSSTNTVVLVVQVTNP